MGSTSSINRGGVAWISLRAIATRPVTIFTTMTSVMTSNVPRLHSERKGDCSIGRSTKPNAKATSIRFLSVSHYGEVNRILISNTSTNTDVNLKSSLTFLTFKRDKSNEEND